MKDKIFEKENELYENAYAEFSEKGYEKASLNNILKKTGISKGTFYYHFKNKEDLYIKLLHMAFDKKKEIMNDIYNKYPDTTDIFKIMEMQAEAFVKYAFENKLFYKFSVSFLKEKGTDIYEKVFSSAEEQKNEIIDKIIKTGIKNGSIRKDLPESFLKNALIYFFFHAQEFIDFFSDFNDKETLTENYNSFLKILKNGFSGKNEQN
ncbi:MAG: TetR/AcrR family transcriptional regulator [Thermotogae bacterium]|nr:TetR/AcrR family transcriptional regulator [Thermotogota bacterium]